MFVPFKLVRAVSGHLSNNGVGNSLNEKHRRREVAQIVNPQIFNTRKIANTAKTLADVDLLGRFDWAK
jgi:hypothetical protein